MMFSIVEDKIGYLGTLLSLCKQISNNVIQMDLQMFPKEFQVQSQNFIGNI